ncbi:MAG: TssQ family T6SS-associated lipoprotein [Burkholderiales bacterium]
MNTKGTLVVVASMLSGCASVPLFQGAREPEPSPAPQSESVQVEPAPPVAEPKREPAPQAQIPAKIDTKPKRAPQLQAGIEAYDNGRHREAAKLLRAALASKPGPADEVEAHKYLAFIECSLNRRRQCGNEFRKALAIDPNLELSPAEAGHPVWGPIFRNLKRQKPRR